MLSLGASVLLGHTVGLIGVFAMPLLLGPASGSGTTFGLVAGIIGVAVAVVVGLVLGPVPAQENRRAG